MTAIDQALAPYIERALAQEHLLDFGRLIYPGFETPPHIEYIADRLEAAERGQKRRIAISVPVRHGKSVLSSQLFPAWCVGRNPRRNVIVASHSESLATLHSRAAKHMVEDDRWPFAVVKLSPDSTSVQRWNVVQGGGLYAVGVGGSITGRGADALIIDDALHDGLSQAERDAAWRWYTEVATPRLEPGGIVIVIGARFADDDLIGHILESEDAGAWEYIRLPALSEGADVDPLGRAEGEPLWPARMDRAELEARRVAMGSRAFSAQFQQNPVPEGGCVLEAAWFEHRYDVAPLYRVDVDPAPFISTQHDPLQALINREHNRRPAVPAFAIQAVDCAASTSASSDRTAICTALSDGRDFFVIDLAFGRYGYSDMKRFALEQFEKHRHQVRVVYVEYASSGIALVDELRRTTSIPIVPFETATSRSGKAARIEAAMPLLEAGRVKFPRHAPWMTDLVNEALRWPSPSAHDDLIDVVCTAVTKLAETVARAHHAERFRRRVIGGFPNLMAR